MDDDKQITARTAVSGFDFVDSETRLFFREDTMQILKGSAPDIYDVEAEFSKAKKNHSWSVILTIIGVITVTVCGLFITTWIISRQTRSVPESISTFDDLNLKNILDMASRIESSYQSALVEKSALEGELSLELSDLEANAEAERVTIRSLSLPRNEENVRIARVNTKLDVDRDNVRAKYVEPLGILNAKIEEYRIQLASFDKTRIEQAEEQRKTANAEYLRFEHEKETMRAQYEETIANLRAIIAESQKTGLQAQSENVDVVASKYKAEIAALDPTWNNAQNAAIIEGTSAPDAAVPLSDERLTIFAEMNVAYRDMNALSSELLTIPWKNNTPAYIKGMDALFYKTVRAAGGDIRRLSDNMAAQKQTFEAQIAELQASITELSARNEALERETETVKADNASLSAYVAALTADKEALSAEKRALTQEKNTLIHENAVLTADKEALSAEKRALTQEKNTLIHENAALTADLDAANNLLDRNRQYFRALTEKNGAAGYVIDLKNGSDILVYIDPLFGLAFKSQKAFIFRTGNEYVGTVAISGADRVFTASTVELAPGMTIEPNDKILLETSKRSMN
ncbi:MAG: hypothetical protein LBG05_04265 [Treponema sp.]|nr:hypothetical protein [Treponema sp.]